MRPAGESYTSGANSFAERAARRGFNNECVSWQIGFRAPTFSYLSGGFGSSGKQRGPQGGDSAGKQRHGGYHRKALRHRNGVCVFGRRDAKGASGPDEVASVVVCAQLEIWRLLEVLRDRARPHSESSSVSSAASNGARSGARFRPQVPCVGARFRPQRVQDFPPPSAGRNGPVAFLQARHLRVLAPVSRNPVPIFPAQRGGE